MREPSTSDSSATHRPLVGHEVVIVSSDKNFAQLVCERLWMQDTIKDVIYGSELQGGLTSLIH